MQEKLPAEIKNNSYPSTKAFFEDFEHQFPRSLEEAKSRNDASEIRKLEEWKKELDLIVRSLEGGNPGPAKEKISSMIEKNIEFIRLGVPNNLTGETHGEVIRGLTNFLVELEAAESGRAVAGKTETSSTNTIEGSAMEPAEFDNPSAEEITRSLNELEAIELQLKTRLEETRRQKKEFNELLRKARLSRLRDEISGRDLR